MYNFKINKNLFINLSIISIFSIGRFADNRLMIYDFHIGYMFSLAYVLAFIFILFSRNFDRYLFFTISLYYLIFLIQGIINWNYWGFNINDSYSFSKFLVFSLITIPACLFVSSINTIQDLKAFIKHLSWVGAFLFLLTFVEFILFGQSSGRLSAIGGGPIVYSRWIGVFFISLYYNNIKMKKIKYYILFICLIFMLFSGSRGPIIFLLISIFFSSLLSSKYNKISYLIPSIFMLLILGFFFNNYILFLLNEINNPIINRVFGISLGSGFYDGTSTIVRLLFYTDSIELIKNNIFGIGIGNFSIYSNYGYLIGMTSYPHNLLLEVFVEQGIIIFLMLLFIILKCFYDFLIQSKNKYFISDDKLFFTIWLFIFLNSLVSGDLSDSRLVFLLTTIFYRYIFLKNRKL